MSLRIGAGLSRSAPVQRRIPAPKHDLLHRLKRLWRFLDNPRIDAQALQLPLIPTTITALGQPRLLVNEIALMSSLAETSPIARALVGDAWP